MPTGSITLGQVAALIPTLNIACDRCERAGKYRLDTLIVRHGAGFGIPLLLSMLSADCPKRASVSAYDLSAASTAPNFRRCFFTADSWPSGSATSPPRHATAA
jgi:hypothetical protein